ncbi:carbohydrate binding domain-containing protein [Candidatus Poribacteria bacterium]
MQTYWPIWLVVMIFAIFGTTQGICEVQSVAPLPKEVKAVWDLSKAYRESTPTRERVCLNGLWRWQPVENMTNEVPTDGWGYFKVPGPWPGITSYMQHDSQTLYRHPNWENENLRSVKMAWYQREITVPSGWSDRRITVYTEYLNSHAIVYVDGAKMGEIRFPGGEVDLTSACRPGGKYVLSLFTTAMPLNAVVMSYNDTNAARRVAGTVSRRGLCGDVFLTSTSAEERITDIKVDTSVRKWEITFDTALKHLEQGKEYSLRAQIADDGGQIKEFSSKRFTAADLESGRFASTYQWKPMKLWDVHTPGNMYTLELSLLDSEYDAIAKVQKVLDVFRPVRFGFRELWIDGRDLMLNGTRFFSSITPLDNAMVSTATASYEGTRESLKRLKAIGINTMYTHNYGCQPGTHLSFEELLRAADDVGMLISFSQPHYGHYEWDADDADDTNGYAQHAEFYVRVAQNHPSVVMYSMNHNALSYYGSSNPDLIDGIHDAKGYIGPRTDRGARRGERTEAIVKRFDSTRVIYHHSSGNLGQMHTSNLYLNFVPIQERSDWFEHWATEGVKPLYLVEYGMPWGINWAMYRGWYKDERAFGSAKVPWEFCAAEWDSQFLGDSVYQLTDMEKENLRFETKQWRAGRLWNRWDYPFRIVSGHPRKKDVWAMYIAENWRAFRTWNLSGFSTWGFGTLWELRDGVDRGREALEVDWDNLQRPGFSADFIEGRYERIDMAYETSDWIPTNAAKAVIRNNRPLLAYIAGKPARFTSKDHNFLPGETVEKQIIIINNSREIVECECSWSLALPEPLTGSKSISVATGEQGRIPLQFALPVALSPGEYELTMTVKFSSGETQDDSFAIHVLPPKEAPKPGTKIALYDPKGETARLLEGMGVLYERVNASADLAGYDVLIVGKEALTVDKPAPDIGCVRDGLKVIMFEQTADVLEKRLGFRVQEYGLRRVFERVPDHPILADLGTDNLHDWQGEATILPPRREEYLSEPQYYPGVERSGIKVSRAWRAGCRGNVASVLMEKPTRGDFLPIVDGGFSLQYSPLMEYHEGAGIIVFCQMDVTGRTEDDPAAMQLTTNMLDYVSAYSATQRRKVLYAGDPAGKAHLEQAGILSGDYSGGELTSGQVLVVGPGGGTQLTLHREAIAAWLKADGHVLAIGLDEQEANAFLPFSVTMKKAEHISAHFDPASAKSLLAGIASADVHNRDPREIELVSGGVTVVGNGVLAVAEDANVIFFQLAPWQFDYEKLYNVKRTFRRTSFLVTRLLGNMGVSSDSTLLLSRFSSPVAVTTGASLIKNGDFSMDTDGDGLADHWQFEASSDRSTFARERVAADADQWSQSVTYAGSDEEERGQAMLAQYDVPMKEGQWYRISFRAKSEGLKGNNVSMTITDTSKWQSFFEYQRFIPGEEWKQFTFKVESNGTASSQTRLQIWYNNMGKVWFSDMRMEACDPPWQGRWLTGLYLDKPVEMDDPYRYFNW